jgi:hypothetical protein
MDYNFDHQMCKCSYSNNWLHFLKRAVPLHYQSQVKVVAFLNNHIFLQREEELFGYIRLFVMFSHLFDEQ